MLRSKRAWAKWARKSRFRYRYSHTRNMTVPFSIWCAHSSSHLIFLSISHAVLTQCCILFFVLFCFFLKKNPISFGCQSFQMNVRPLFWLCSTDECILSSSTICTACASWMPCTYIYFIRGVLLCIDNGAKIANYDVDIKNCECMCYEQHTFHWHWFSDVEICAFLLERKMYA